MWKKGHQLRECPNLTQAEKDKVWKRTEKEWAQETKLWDERKSREESAKTGMNHLSTDEKTVEVVISVDIGATGGLSSYAGG